MPCSKRIVALHIKCPECGKSQDYIGDAKYWEDGTTLEDKDVWKYRICIREGCSTRIEVPRDCALKHIFIKEFIKNGCC